VAEHTGTGRAAFPEWLAFIRHHLENPAVKSALGNLTQQAQDLVASFGPTLVRGRRRLVGVFGFVASVAIIPVYLFFFLLSGNADPTRRLSEHLTFLKDEHRDDVVFLIREFLASSSPFPRPAADRVHHGRAAGDRVFPRGAQVRPRPRLDRRVDQTSSRISGPSSA